MATDTGFAYRLDKLTQVQVEDNRTKNLRTYFS